MLVVPAEAGGVMPHPALFPLGKGPAGIPPPPVSGPASVPDASSVAFVPDEPPPDTPVALIVDPVDAPDPVVSVDESVPGAIWPEAAAEPDPVVAVPVEAAVELLSLVASNEATFPELEPDPLEALVGTGPAGALASAHPVSPITKRQKWRRGRMSS